VAMRASSQGSELAEKSNGMTIDSHGQSAQQAPAKVVSANCSNVIGPDTSL